MDRLRLTSAEAVELAPLGPIQKCTEFISGVDEDRAVRVLRVPHCDLPAEGSQFNAGSVSDAPLSLAPGKFAERRARPRHSPSPCSMKLSNFTGESVLSVLSSSYTPCTSWR